MISVKAQIGLAHFKTIITNGTHSITSDDAIALGGTNQGFNPMELMAASLASCTSITLRMYCDRKAIEMNQIEVKVELDKNELNENIFTRNIYMSNSITAEQQQRLIQIANLCPVSKLLSNGNTIITSLEAIIS